MLLSPRKNGLDFLIKEVTVFKVGLWGGRGVFFAFIRHKSFDGWFPWFVVWVTCSVIVGILEKGVITKGALSLEESLRNL